MFKCEFVGADVLVPDQLRICYSLLYDVNIEKVCQWNYLVNVFQSSANMFAYVRAIFFSHCCSMSLYVGFIIKFKVVVLR